MSTYKELVYMCLDEMKLHSDDTLFTEEHILFLLSKYRTFLLKQRYSDIKKPIPESNYQTICLDLMEVPAISGEPCEGGVYLKSKQKIPFLMKIGNPTVYPIDYYQGSITLVSRERMKYIGYNKYLQNIIYASVGPDNYLYFKSSNPQYLYLEKVRMTGIFEDPQAASELECSEMNEDICDLMDKTFPIEDALIPPMIELITKELLRNSRLNEDTENNANDDLSNTAYGDRTRNS